MPYGSVRVQGDDFLCLIIPGGKVGQCVVIDSFDDFANYRLLVKIMLFSFFQRLEVLLMTAIDYG